MNIFTLIGDVLHLLSIVIILAKIYTLKNCKGISLKTQFCYALVFLTRYLDLFWNFHSMYNWFMKIIFISTACCIVYLMRFKVPICETYDQKADFVNLWFVITPCFLLSLVLNDYFSITEILWTFSIYLEAVAIVPQLMVVHAQAKQQNGFVEKLTSDYVFTLGGYRVLYLINWVYRYMTEDSYFVPIVWISGLVQTLIYIDFFYFYAIAKMRGEKMTLPI